jgi:hypothetical protein
MAQGPILIFDKSTIQTLTVDESVLLDNFYMSNIVPVFFAECLADLERDMQRMKSKGSPESLVGALATRTPDSQACGNVFHMRILEGELMGNFDLSQVRYRPLRDRGQPVITGDSKGILFRASEEEEAVRRWAARDFLDLERQIAKQWRRMIERIDLNAMSSNVLSNIGPWRKPTSLEDAKFLTDQIIDCVDQEWLLRFGLQTLGIPEAIDPVVNRWLGDRRKALRSYVPYFIHMLSINIFFALVLPTNLLSKVKPSHTIDLAYLYYLPFCTIFTSRDNFHVQVAPFFMNPFQTFVHGDELKSDLGRLHEMYQQLPQEELDKGLIGFADCPPEDTSFLTTRLWDKYLPKWREPHMPYTELPEDILDAIAQMGKKVMDATPTEAHGEYDVDKLDFVTISKKVSPKKGSYLRFSKETILKIHDDEERKAREDEIKEGASIYEPGTAFATLSEKLARLSKDPKCSNVLVFLLMNKLDQVGKKVVRDGVGVGEIHPIEIHLFDEETQAFLKHAYDKSPVLSVLVLWTRYGAGKLGILRLKPVPGEDTSMAGEYEDWERKAIAAYLHRHNL